MSRPFIPVPNTVSVELIYTFGNLVTLENVVHVAKTTPFTGAQISSLRTTLIAWFGAHLQTHFYGNCGLTRVRIKALDSTGAPMEDYTLPAILWGTTPAAGNMPSSNCIAVKLATGLTGRSFRGRVYVPVTASNGLDAGNPNNVLTALGNGFVADFNALITTIPAWDANAKLVVTSYMADKAWRTEGLNTPIITASLVDYHMDCQRRRLAGRGI